MDDGPFGWGSYPLSWREPIDHHRLPPAWHESAGTLVWPSSWMSRDSPMPSTSLSTRRCAAAVLTLASGSMGCRLASIDGDVVGTEHHTLGGLNTGREDGVRLGFYLGIGRQSRWLSPRGHPRYGRWPRRHRVERASQRHRRCIVNLDDGDLVA